MQFRAQGTLWLRWVELRLRVPAEIPNVSRDISCSWNLHLEPSTESPILVHKLEPTSLSLHGSADKARNPHYGNALKILCATHSSRYCANVKRFLSNSSPRGMPFENTPELVTASCCEPIERDLCNLSIQSSGWPSGIRPTCTYHYCRAKFYCQDVRACCILVGPPVTVSAYSRPFAATPAGVRSGRLQRRSSKKAAGKPCHVCLIGPHNSNGSFKVWKMRCRHYQRKAPANTKYALHNV